MILNEIYKLYLSRGTIFTAMSFYALSLFCFSLALSPEEITFNSSIFPFLWILMILTFFFSVPLFVKFEYQEGLLDEIFLHSLLPCFYILSKIGAEILILGLPLLGIGILFSLSLPCVEVFHIALTLLIGFPPLSALGILGALLTLRTQRGGILAAILLIPFTIPLFILALSILEMTRLGLDPFPSFCLLISVSLFLTILSVGASHWALNFAMEG